MNYWHYAVKDTVEVLTQYNFTSFFTWFDCEIYVTVFQTLPASGKNFQTEENNYGNNKANIFNAESCMPLSKLDENMKNKIRKNAIAPITQACDELEETGAAVSGMAFVNVLKSR
ncbi:unnamed protein product [Clavelina lepadiformis]|uniref:Uncharacterized protein n=1 Tax=Clavelina lepadiformis TaxID=159417 RepID=A0ABP0FDN3_CLALP